MGKYFAIRNGEVIGVADTEEEIQEIVDADIADSERIIRTDYDLDEETSDTDIAFMIGHDIGYTYYEYIELDDIEEDGDYTTNEGDEFSKSELEGWV